MTTTPPRVFDFCFGKKYLEQVHVNDLVFSHGSPTCFWPNTPTYENELTRIINPLSVFVSRHMTRLHHDVMAVFGPVSLAMPANHSLVLELQCGHPSLKMLIRDRVLPPFKLIEVVLFSGQPLFITIYFDDTKSDWLVLPDLLVTHLPFVQPPTAL